MPTIIIVEIWFTLYHLKQINKAMAEPTDISKLQKEVKELAKLVKDAKIKERWLTNKLIASDREQKQLKLSIAKLNAQVQSLHSTVQSSRR